MDKQGMRLHEFFVTNGINEKIIDDQEMDKLKKVDDVIDKKLQEASELNRKLLKCRINIVNVASDEDCPVSRKTFYNDSGKRLKEYVEFRAASLEKGETDWKARCEDLEAKVKLMVIRDIRLEEDKIEREKLHDRIAELEKKNKELQDRLARFTTGNENVIPFPQGV